MRAVSFSLVLAVFFLGTLQTADSGEDSQTQTPWTLLPVPGAWEEQADGRFADHDGFAWYRCLVTVPGGWGDSELTLSVKKVDNAHAVYFNGAKVGEAGAFPPDYENGLNQSKDYTVPAKHVRPGDENLVAIRVYDHGGRGGFKGAAPILIHGDRAISLDGNWEFRIGDSPEWAEGPVALTNTGIFWRVMDVETARKGAGSQDGGLRPEQALANFETADDLELDLVLAEPTVRQPLFLNWDERGRMWVVQYIQYPYPAGLNMVSKDRHWRAVYDKTPPPPPDHFRGLDKITIHEDTDGDGVYEEHKTFLEGLNLATAVARGRGGVWVLNPPYLLFYPDENRDDVPDGPPEVHLKGFGLEDTHSVVNSLRWGPDGWLYAAQGSTVSGNVVRPGSDEEPVHSMGQLIWRYHPETRRYEIFAEGGGNAFGVEIDSRGRVYSGTNGGDARGYHYVQGGYFRKAFQKHGPLSNPYAYGYFPAMPHHEVPRFTHDFVLYEGASLPEQYHRKLIGIEPLQGQLVHSEIRPHKSSFRTKDVNRILQTDDRWFRPVDLQFGPDGAIYVADYYEFQISHREHFAGQIDKSTGRIYRLRSEDYEPVEPFDLSRKSTRELIELLKHSNRWYRRTALRLIGDRKDQSVIPLLKENIRNAESTPRNPWEPDFALECFWALNLSGGFNEAVAQWTLEHGDPHVRRWTVRLLGDDRKVSDPIARKLAELAQTEPHPQVRTQLACTARRLSAAHGLPVVRNLLRRDEDVDDPYQPLLLWWALEEKIDPSPLGRETAAGRDGNEAQHRPPSVPPSQGGRVLRLFENAELWHWPLVEEHILHRVMRRYAEAGSRSDLLACARLLELAPDPGAKQTLMQGFEKAFEGRPLGAIPTKLARELAKAGGVSVVLGIRQGDSEAVAQALKVVQDPDSDRQKRLSYIQTFGEVDQPECIPVLLEIVAESKDGELQMAALTALQRYESPRIGTAVVENFNGFAEDVRTAALRLLTSRPAWSRQLLQAVDSGKIAGTAISRDAVQRMTIHQDERLTELIRKHFSDVNGASTAERQQRIAELRAVLDSGSGDPYRGKQLYRESCGKCHLMFGEGGRIGPDLTSYNRDDTVRVLLNVVNPSAEIREGFESYLVVTDDGRVVNGFLFDRDNQVVVLRGEDGQNVTISRDRIGRMVRQKKSLMPEELLKEMSDQEIRDLFAYLRSSQPLNN